MTLLRYAFILVFCFLCAGCATIGSYQAQCEQQTSSFPEMVACLKAKVTSDWRPSKRNQKVKLYLLKADQLSYKVQSGEITEIDAKVELQELYLALKKMSDSEKPVRTECRESFGRIKCTTR
ncbi:hypothetical protein [Desulfatitalea alkaliphila]|uniref:Lipoprotein n=1 Tax=Desulfatitalea alkaliphila TaxID=2929485 RepID=A0AA41UK80_9BACT|nr:hypothetical protein [Desulfatitalea alkaliphila]MCJ8500131.1 hypothetical protein [Desulfatitalea alkaliphila]